MLSFKPAFSLSSFTSIKRLFNSSLPSAISVVSSAYLRLLIFLPATLIPACASSSPAFHMMYSVYKLNRQGDNIQPSVRLLSHFRLFVTPWTAAHQASWSIANSQSSLKLMSIESVMPPNHLILCHALLFLPSIFPSIRVFSNESVLHIRWPKYWSFSFSLSPPSEASGLISFRMDWLDLLAIQGTLKSLLQHHNSKASILWGSAFFMVKLSHPYMTTGKTIALILWTFVGKVMSPLFHMCLGLSQLSFQGANAFWFHG